MSILNCVRTRRLKKSLINDLVKLMMLRKTGPCKIDNFDVTPEMLFSNNLFVCLMCYFQNLVTFRGGTN